jgi:hypothetical protein
MNTFFKQTALPKTPLRSSPFDNTLDVGETQFTTTELTGPDGQRILKALTDAPLSPVAIRKQVKSPSLQHVIES